MSPDTTIQDLVSWLAAQAIHEQPLDEMLYGLGMRLNEAGVPVWRWSVAHPVLNPENFGKARAWERGLGLRARMDAPRGYVHDPLWAGSPYQQLVVQELREIRESLTGTSEYPLLEQFHGEGATEYLAYRVPMPMEVTRLAEGEDEGVMDGIVGSWATQAPGGWTDDQRRILRALHVAIALATKATVHRENASDVLAAYLGRDAGTRVMEGAVQRGDVTSIDAVIWFSDLRGSTPLAEQLAPAQFLRVLNDYFECTAGVVAEHGGEILRFIGDAALAIFPVGEDEASRRDACQRALTAATEADRRAAELNATRTAGGLPGLAYGIGLHLGEVLYGNIGTPSRVEFTVIGPAANTAARVEGLSKELDERVVLTGEVARYLDVPLRSRGTHRLRGVEAPLEVFAPEE